MATGREAFLPVDAQATVDVGADTSWIKQGTCLKERHPVDLFFPQKGDSATAQRAKQVCARCPVIEDCLAWSLLVPERSGIWGGCSENDRRSLRQTDPRAKLRICRNPNCRKKFDLGERNAARYCSDQCRRSMNAKPLGGL